ncbi:MAG: hypothetical protein LAP87_11885 [Acidobacteriia bacterium]|nr:hypothetical protein [Terriglobia bacterium]
MEFILEQQARLSVQQEKSAERHDREMAGIRNQLRRAVELSVREARSERRRRQEADARLEEADARQQEADVRQQEADVRLEAMIDRIGRKLEGLIDALRHGGNGAH